MSKYLFISATDFANRKLTGAHKRFIELVKAFAENNEVILISHEYCEFAHKNIVHIPIKKKLGSFLPNHLSELLTLVSILRKCKKEIKYDTAIAFGAHTAIAYWIAGYSNIVSLFREDIIGYQEAVSASKMKVFYYRVLEKCAVDVSRTVIVQCNKDRDSLISRNKKAENKVYVQCNNINVSWINKYEKQHTANPYPVLVFIGNFSNPRKGHQLLLPAVAKLLDENEPLTLYVLGDGRELKKYQEQYSKYDAIHFEGHVNDVGKYLSIADIDIVPSLIDSCPNTVLEGLCSGLAVYGSNTGGIPELLRKQDYMFDASVQSIYAFLSKKIKQKEYLNDMIEQNELVKELTFNWSKEIEKLIYNTTC